MIYRSNRADIKPTPSHIQRIARHTINLQPRQRLRRIIRLVDCPAVVVVVVIIDHTAAAAVHHRAGDTVYIS